MCDLWLADGTHELTAHGNMRAPPRRQTIEWVLEAWEELPTDVITRLFKVSALCTNLDPSEDDQIVCIKHGPCQNLLKKLKVGQLDDVGSDPFDIEVSEKGMCQQDISEVIIDDDDEDDEFHDIED